MAQLTQQARIQRIQQLLAELDKMPPQRHEVLSLPALRGAPLLCQVIRISADEVLLNHQSHRVRAQLEDDPEWATYSNEPHGEAAQGVIERLVRNARDPEDFKALKDSLEHDGQTDPGVMSYDGVLVNANTRAVALREFPDPTKRVIRVAVLPPTTQADEMALLELRLQMQKELKVPYTLTNELLFIEELSVERHMSDAQIAQELRLYPESRKKGENEVRLRLQLLDLVRAMRRVPDEELSLTFFDSLGYEQLREVHRKYSSLMERSQTEAQRHLEAFLISIAADVTPVHRIRDVDADFMSGYMLNQLEDDEEIGVVADLLVAGASDPPTVARPEGVDVLAPDSSEGEQSVDLKRLVNILTQSDKRVSLEGTSVTLEREDVAEAVKAAIIGGIKEKKHDERYADKLEAPVQAVKDAAREMAKAIDAFKVVATDPDFDQKRRKSLEAAYKKLKRTHRELEGVLSKAAVIGK